jgi:hypothetical protein
MKAASNASDNTMGRGESETSRAGVAFGIGATLLLFVGIWRLDRSADRQRGPVMPDLEARYRARGIDPHKVF